MADNDAAVRSKGGSREIGKLVKPRIPPQAPSEATVLRLPHLVGAGKVYAGIVAAEFKVIRHCADCVIGTVFRPVKCEKVFKYRKVRLQLQIPAARYLRDIRLRHGGA